MSVAQQQRQTQTVTVDPNDLAAVLDQAIANSSIGQVGKAINTALESRIAQIEELLPDPIKGQAARLVKRAMLTFSRNAKLQECTPDSFIRCVLDAAEIGLAIDGRLGHAVPYNTNVAPRGSKPVYKTLAQFQPDYKGLIAIAKRSGQIVDAYGDVVCQNDHFVHGRTDDQSRLEHNYELGSDRGPCIGAYAIIKLQGGWRYELMDAKELNRIRGKSKSGDTGPWSTDVDQMRVKTVLKRGLKLYCDDPGLTRALELDDQDYEGERVADATRQKATRSPLNDRLMPVAGGRSQFAAESQQPADDPFIGSEADVPFTPLQQQAADPAAAVQKMKERFELAATAEDAKKIYDEYGHPDSTYPQEAIELASAHFDKAVARLSKKPKGQQSLV
jgi:recombination protein RecT